MHPAMNVLVTGGAGFIGSHLVDRLVNSGYNVKVLDNLSTGNLSNIKSNIDNGKIDFVKGDITNLEQVKNCVSGVDVVFHLAAQVSVPLSIKDPAFNFETNVTGTINLLSTLANKNPNGKFILASSCAVYGDPQKLPADEKTPTNPISPYAETKLLGEYYTLGFNQNKLLKTSALRFFNVYGLRQGLNDYSGVITKFIDRIKQNQPLTVYGDGTQTRDFVHVSNIVDALIACLENSNAEGEVFNVGTGNAITIEDLAKSLIQLSGASCTVNHAPAREGDIKHSYANIAKAQNKLNYHPTMQLSTGLQELLLAANADNR